MLNRRNVSRVLVVSGLAAASIAGCSSGGSSDGEQTLTVTTIYQDIWDRPLAAAAERYEEGHPGVSITVQTIPYEAHTAALETQFVAQNAPDVIHVEPPELTSFSSRGFLLPLTEELAEGGWGDSFNGDSLSSLAAQDGEHYTVPWSRIHVMVQYNKDVYEEAGVSVPTTYDEQLETFDGLQEAGFAPLYVGFDGTDAAFWWRLTPMLDAMYRPYTEQINLRHGDGWQYDSSDPGSVTGEVYTADEKYIAFMNGITDPAVSPEYRTAIELTFALKPYLQEDINSYTFQANVDLFANGELANTNGTGADIANRNAQQEELGLPQLDIGQYDYPTITQDNWPDLTDGGVNPIAAVRNGFAVNASSPNTDLAVDFLRYLTEPENVTAIYADGELDGVYRIGEPSAVSGVTYPPASNLQDDDVAIVAQLPLYGFGSPPTYDAQDFDEFKSQYQQLFSGTMSVDEFLSARSASNLAALERNLEVYSAEVDQDLIAENVSN